MSNECLEEEDLRPSKFPNLLPGNINKKEPQLRLPSKGKLEDPEFYEKPGAAKNLVDLIKDVGPTMATFHPALWTWKKWGLIKGLLASDATHYIVNRILNPEEETHVDEGEADPDAEYKHEKPKIKSDLGKKAQDDIDAEAWRKYGLPLNLHDYGGF